MKHKWINLHSHSEYSNFDGSIKINDLVDYHEKQGLNAVALTDHGMMCGITDLYNKTKSKNIKPIYGCELYSESLLGQDSKNYHLLALAKTREGYHNLLKLVSKASTENFYYKPRVNLNMLKQYGKGIIFSTACVAGELSSLIEKNEIDKAVMFMHLLSSVGDGAYVEMTDVGPKQYDLNQQIYRFAIEHGFNPLLTLDSHYLPKDRLWHPYMLAAGMKKSYQELKANNGTLEDYDLSLRASEDIGHQWGNVYPEAIANAGLIADSIERFEIFSDKFLLPSLHSEETNLHEKAHKGLAQRLAKLENIDEQIYYDRLDMELGVISRMGFDDYFLILADVIGWAVSQNIAVGPGRGSGAGSVVAWSLGITQIDPIRFGLIFERFLNPDRKTMPDIDVDFEDKRRYEVIEYIRGKYGDDAVCGIISYSRPKLRGAIKDACRAMGVPVGLGDPGEKLAKIIAPRCDEAEEQKLSQKDAEKMLAQIELPKSVTKLIPLNTRLSIFRLATKLTGVLRHFGRHAAGLIVAPGKITDHAPLASVKGEIVSQFDMSGVETAKLIKFDLLGLQTMSMLMNCIKIASETYPEKDIPSLQDLYNVFNSNKAKLQYGNGKNISEKSLEETLSLLASGDSTGVFQLESPGMKRLLKQVKPVSLDDLSCQLALYRPGPIESGMVDGYIRACEGSDDNSHKPFPLEVNDRTSKICEDSKGVCIYQEQVMKIASEIAGYTAAEADVLRRAMGKKKVEVMEKEKVVFVERAKKQGVSEKAAVATFDSLAKFSGYGFNKAHSMAYAFLAMASAWFKSTYPGPFWAAFLEMKYRNDKKDNLYPHFREYSETQNKKILLPDICDGIDDRVLNARVKIEEVSDEYDYHGKYMSEIDSGNVVLGLKALNGIGDKQIEALKNFPFSDSLEEMIYHVSVSNTLSPKKFCSLLFSGVLDRAIEKAWQIDGFHGRALFMMLNGEWQKNKNIKEILGDFYDVYTETYQYRRPRKMESGDIKEPYHLAREKMRDFPLGEICLLVEDLSRANSRKRNKWDKDRIKNKISTFISALGDVLCYLNDRHKQLCNNSEYKASYECGIYCHEKDLYGDVLSLDPLAIARHVVQDNFDYFPKDIPRGVEGEILTIGVLHGIATIKNGKTAGIISARETDNKFFVELDSLDKKLVRNLENSIGDFVVAKGHMGEKFPFFKASNIQVIPMTGELFDTERQKKTLEGGFYEIL